MRQEFSSYFDSYENRAPSWTERVRITGSRVPGLDKEIEKTYDRVTPHNYPKICKAFEDECAFRGVEMPACYVDRSGKTRLGRALQVDYAVLIDERANNIFNDREMRALAAHELKHLYQGKAQSREEKMEAEYDSDRAAITSTDYETIRSYVDKAIHLMIEERVPTSVLRRFMHSVHDAFPGVIAENFFVPTDRSHPSAASRMRAMRSTGQYQRT